MPRREQNVLQITVIRTTEISMIEDNRVAVPSLTVLQERIVDRETVMETAIQIVLRMASTRIELPRMAMADPRMADLPAMETDRVASIVRDVPVLKAVRESAGDLPMEQHLEEDSTEETVTTVITAASQVKHLQRIWKRSGMTIRDVLAARRIINDPRRTISTRKRKI